MIYEWQTAILLHIFLQKLDKNLFQDKIYLDPLQIYK